MKSIMQSWRKYVLEKYKRVGLNEDTDLTRRDFLKKTAAAAGMAGAALGASVLGAEEEEPPSEEHKTAVYMSKRESDPNAVHDQVILNVAPLTFKNGDPVVWYQAPILQQSAGYTLSMTEQSMERLLKEDPKLAAAYRRTAKRLIDEWPIKSVFKAATMSRLHMFTYNRNKAQPFNKYVHRLASDPSGMDAIQFYLLGMYFVAVRKIFKLKVDKFAQEMADGKRQKTTDEVLFNNGLYKIEEAYKMLEEADNMEDQEAKMIPFERLDLPPGKTEYWEQRDGERYIDGKYNPPKQDQYE